MTPSPLRWHRHQHCIDPQTPKLLFPAILHITLHFPSHRHSLLHTCICLHSAFCTLMTTHLGSAHRMALHSPSSPVHHCYPRISTLEPGLVLVPSSGYPARALLCYASPPSVSFVRPVSRSIRARQTGHRVLSRSIMLRPAQFPPSLVLHTHRPPTPHPHAVLSCTYNPCAPRLFTVWNPRPRVARLLHLDRSTPEAKLPQVTLFCVLVGEELCIKNGTMCSIVRINVGNGGNLQRQLFAIVCLVSQRPPKARNARGELTLHHHIVGSTVDSSQVDG